MSRLRPSLTWQDILLIYLTVEFDKYQISADTISPGIGVRLDQKKMDQCISYFYYQPSPNQREKSDRCPIVHKPEREKLLR